MTEPTTLPEDNEISFRELWQMLTEGWRWIVGGAVAGIIGAIGYLEVTPSEYEAMALIQVGQVGQVGQAGTMPIEAPAWVVERLKFPTFQDAVIKKLGWNGGEKEALYRGSLKATISKSSDLIELRMRALTQEDASRSIGVTIEHLAVLHKTLAQPAIESLQAELQEVSAEARDAEKVLRQLERAARNPLQASPRDRFSELVLYMQLAAGKESRIRELRRREAQYREWISMTDRAATVFVEPPWIPEEPASPKKAQALMLATLGGLLLGAITVILRRW